MTSRTLPRACLAVVAFQKAWQRESGRAYNRKTLNQCAGEKPRHIADGQGAQGSHGDASRQSSAHPSHRGVGRVTRNRQVSAYSADDVLLLAFCCCAVEEVLHPNLLPGSGMLTFQLGAHVLLMS